MSSALMAVSLAIRKSDMLDCTCLQLSEAEWASVVVVVVSERLPLLPQVALLERQVVVVVVDVGSEGKPAAASMDYSGPTDYSQFACSHNHCFEVHIHQPPLSYHVKNHHSASHATIDH